MTTWSWRKPLRVSGEKTEGLDEGQLFASQIAREGLDEASLPYIHVELVADDLSRSVAHDALLSQVHCLGHSQGLLNIRFGEV